MPRAEQLVITRATLYVNTFIMPPTAGWSLVPLVDYHAGGAAAAFWPPSAHLQEYETALAMHLSYGVAACYRGPGLFDTPAVQRMVAGWVSWFKAHQDILISDIVHIRHPDGQSVDGIVHVNSALPEFGLAAFFNPTLEPISTNISVPLYYAGVAAGDMVAVAMSSPASTEHLYAVRANTRSRIALPLTVPAKGHAMFVFTKGHATE